VFADRLGHPMSEKRLRDAFRTLLDEARCLQVRLDDTQAHNGQPHATQGKQREVVSEPLGHSTVDITLDTYSHVLPGTPRPGSGEAAGSAWEDGPVARSGS
jgi:hypothetical protein